MADIEFEIDGKTLKAAPGQTIIQVADAAGIYIPRFCYHKHLTIAANCRMCLVEVEKSPKTLPACATPVTPHMKVFTKTQKTIDAQRAVMEFLLINHPLDCPICDQGGECELQDLSMGYGASRSCYDEPKRSVADQDLGPLIATEMTRCIYCTRCVRFGDEIAGFREMGAIGRGEYTEIGTYVTHAIQSEVSGNIIDLCPVGALTSKPYRFRARAWELKQYPSVSPHDCLGTNINVHTRYDEVMRVVSRENKEINETWIADRDRFSYTGLSHTDRLEKPMVRIHGKWEVVDWQKAFELVTAGLQGAIAQYGSDSLGALASPSSTTEEFYLLQKIIRALGSPHLDHRLRESDTKDQDSLGAYPGIDFKWSELEECDSIFLIGSNLQKEQPLAALRVRKAALKGANVTVLNPIDYRFNFNVTNKKIVAPALLPSALASLLDTLKIGVKEEKKKSCVLLGALALHHPEASSLRYLAMQLAKLTGAKLGFLTNGANSAGGWLSGFVPHRLAAGGKAREVGLSAYEMLQKPRKAYVLLNVDPELDCANAALAKAALKEAHFTVALSTYRNALLEAHAHVILPMSAFTETSGTFINVEGKWQGMKGIAKTKGDARPAWKILRVLGNFLHLEGFNYESSKEVKSELYSRCYSNNSSCHSNSCHPSESWDPETINNHESWDPATFTKKETGRVTDITRIGEVPLYSIDSLTRHSTPLQKTQILMEGDQAFIRLHPSTASHLNIKDGDKVKATQKEGEATLIAKLDNRIAENAALIAAAIPETDNLGDLFGEVTLKPC